MFDIFRKKGKAKVEEELPSEDVKAESVEEKRKKVVIKTPEELESKEENKKIIEIMKKVKDPELGVDIWTLGLIYDIEIKEKLNITMTFTTPLCPYGPQIINDLVAWLKVDAGIKDPNIQLVFDPPWKPSDEVRDALGV